MDRQRGHLEKNPQDAVDSLVWIKVPVLLIATEFYKVYIYDVEFLNKCIINSSITNRI